MTLRSVRATARVSVAHLQSLESRTLLAFAGLDASYGVGGVTRPAGNGGTVGLTFPLAAGGSIVEVSRNDIRRLDANGKIVKSFGGGDGVLTPVGATLNTPVLVAVDRNSGRIAIRVDVKGGELRLYAANGTFERKIDASAAGGSLSADRMVFDRHNRLLLLNENRIARINATTGAADTTFGTNGLVTLPTDPLPAGNVRFNMTNGDDQSSLKVVGLVLRPSTGSGDGEITIVRTYTTDEPLNGFEAGDYLELTRLTADGQPLANSVTTIRVGFSGRANAHGGVDSTRLDVIDVGPSFNSSASGAVTLLARRSQSSTSSGQPTKSYSEFQLFNVTTKLGKAHDLDNLLLIRKGAGVLPSDVRLAVAANGVDGFVVGNNRVIAFDARTGVPFSAYKGAANGLQLSAKGSAFPVVDSRGRLLLSDSARIRAVVGPVSDLGSTPGVATLLADSTLDVAGTSKNDKVTFTAGSNKRISVTINGHTQLFDRKLVTGIVVHTGKGNDRIDGSRLNDIAAGLFIQSGSGNDTVTGSDGDDTFVAGDGHDTFDGRAGQDLAYSTSATANTGRTPLASALFSDDEVLLF